MSKTLNYPNLSIGELEAVIAIIECSEPAEEVQDLEESALAKFRRQYEIATNP